MSSNLVEVTGIVLLSAPVKEYDTRLVLLTRERGKISAFANGTRKVNNPLTGATRAFAFGTFSMYEGRDYYSVKQASITNFFEEIYGDLDAMMYACYFAELADYYARENVDGKDMINLLYISLKALGNASIPNALVRRIYELKLVDINGELPDMFSCGKCGGKDNKLTFFEKATLSLVCSECRGVEGSGMAVSDSTVYTLQYILSAGLEKLYKFTVSNEVLKEIEFIADCVTERTIDKRMKSLEMLD